MPAPKWALKKAGIEKRENFENTYAGIILTESKSYVVQKIGEYTKEIFSGMVHNSTRSMTFYGRNFNPLTAGSVAKKAGLKMVDSFVGGMDNMTKSLVDSTLEGYVHSIIGSDLAKASLEKPEIVQNHSLGAFYEKYGLTPDPDRPAYIGEGLTTIIGTWEWQDYFLEDNWRKDIMPHLIGEQFKDTLAFVQSAIVQKYKDTPNQAQMIAEMNAAAQDLADQFHQYTVDLADKTEALEVPIHFIENPERQAAERQQIADDPDLTLEQKAEIMKTMDLQAPVLDNTDLNKFTMDRIRGTAYKSNLGTMTEIKEAQKRREEPFETLTDEELSEAIEAVPTPQQPEKETPQQAQAQEQKPEAPAKEDEKKLQELAKHPLVTQLPKWQQKELGIAPRVERGFFSNMANGLYYTVASAGANKAASAAEAAMKRMAKAASCPMTFAGKSFNKTTVKGRLVGATVGRFANTVADYIRSYGVEGGPVALKGDAVAREAFETLEFSEKLRNDLYNQIGIDFDGPGVLKQLAEDLRNWPDKDQFYDNTWRDEIVPHILRTSFNRELKKLQDQVVANHLHEGQNNVAALETKLQMATRGLATIYQNYSEKLADQTSILSKPLFCVDKKLEYNKPELRNVVGAKKYDEFKKSMESQKPLIDEKAIRTGIRRALRTVAPRKSADIGNDLSPQLKQAVTASTNYDPSFTMKAISDIRELEARCARTGFFGRNLPFFNRSYKRTMSLVDSLKGQVRYYVNSRQPAPDIDLDELFDLKTPFETDNQIQRTISGREFREKFPQKSMMEKGMEIATNVATATVETVKSVAQTAVNVVTTAYNVVTSEAGMKVMNKVVEDVTDLTINTMKTIADTTVDMTKKVADLTMTGIEKVTNTVGNVIQTTTDTISNATETVVNVATNAVNATISTVSTGASYVAGGLQYGASLISNGWNWLMGNQEVIEENPQDALALMSEEEAREIDQTYVEKLKEDGGIEAVKEAIPDPKVLEKIAPELVEDNIQLDENEINMDEFEEVQEMAEEPEEVLEEGEHKEVLEEGEPEEVLEEAEPEVVQAAGEPEPEVIKNDANVLEDDDEDEEIFEDALSEEDLKLEEADKAIKDIKAALEQKQKEITDSFLKTPYTRALTQFAGFIVCSALSKSVAEYEKKLGEVDPMMKPEQKIEIYDKTIRDLRQYEKQLSNEEYDATVKKLATQQPIRQAFISLPAPKMTMQQKANWMAEKPERIEMYCDTYRGLLKKNAQQEKDAEKAPTKTEPVKSEPQKTNTQPVAGGNVL